MLIDPRAGTGQGVQAAIQTASRSTGASFDYLLRTAVRESALDPSARAATSSARGLFQFIESTWLAMVKEDGPKYGLGREAAQIERAADGRYFVRNRAARAQILKLREDPQIASFMAGALARRNAAELTPSLGRPPTSGELYIAHFLGAGGAKRLFALKGARPDASASAAFPEAARANRSIFYRANGAPRSAQEVYAVLTSRHDRHPAPTLPRPSVAPTALAAINNSVQPQTAAANTDAPAQAATSKSRSALAAEEGPVFQNLFRPLPPSDGAVARAVQEIWGDLDAASAWLKASAEAAAVGKEIGVAQQAAVADRVAVNPGAIVRDKSVVSLFAPIVHFLPADEDGTPEV